MYFNPDARPFKADTQKHDQPEPTPISWESDMLMPGRTITRTYHFNWVFILREVLGGPRVGTEVVGSGRKSLYRFYPH